MRPFNPASLPPPPGEIISLPSGPLCVEVGAGQGLFAVQFAQAHPATTLVAIERTQTRFAQLQQRLAHNHCASVIPIRANAINWIAHRLPAQSVDQYFFFYPNPYPKQSQQNKRFHAMPFMAYIIETLKPGGSILMTTNQAFYYEEMKEFMVNEWGLACPINRRVDPSSSARTHFEKKYLGRGEPCWEAVFQRH